MQQYSVVHIVSGDLWAGAEVQAYNLVKALQKQQQVHVVLFNEGVLADKLRQAAIHVVVIEESQHGFINLCLKLRKILQELNSDIIHTHGYKESIVSTVANQLATRAITIRTEHGNPEFTVPWWKLHRYLQHQCNLYIARYINKCVIAVSAQLQEALQSRLAIKDVRLIENAIDVQEVEKIAMHKPVHYADNTFNIACVGRLVNLKRQDLLLELMACLPEKTDRPCRLYLFGDGPNRESLTELTTQYKVTEQVEIVGEVQPLYPHLGAMDLLIMPSDHEGLPMTLLETMALKVPVIAHAVGGIPVVLSQGKGGTLVKQHDVQGYLQALLTLLENPQLATDKANIAYDYVKQHYDINNKVLEYDALYKELIQAYAK